MSIAGLTGQKLAGLYQLIAPISQGARSVVYDARHAFTGARLAIKIFYPQVISPEALLRCRRDGEMAAALHHEGIARVVEWNRPDAGLTFVVLEYIPGEDLYTRVKRLGRLLPQHALELGLRVGVILSAAHKLGVLHRGLTPRNIMYTQAGPSALEHGEVVKILDFGIAHLPPLLEMEHTLLPYVAPEQTEGGEVDARTDQYALGALLHLALSGREATPPQVVPLDLADELSLTAPPLSTLCPEAPGYMVRAIERALSPARSDRYASIIDFIRALDDRGLHPWRTSPHRARTSLSGTTPLLMPSARSGSAASSSSGKLRVPSSVTGRSGELPSSGSSNKLRPLSSASSVPKLPLVPSASSVPKLPIPASSASASNDRIGSMNSLAPVTIPRSGASAALPRSRGVFWASFLTLSVAAIVWLFLHGPRREVNEPAPAASSEGAATVVAKPVAEPPPTRLDPDVLLAESETALGQGELARAIELARGALPSQHAWRVIAVAACRLGDTRLAEEAFGHLGPEQRADAQEDCRRARAR